MNKKCTLTITYTTPYPGYIVSHTFTESHDTYIECSNALDEIKKLYQRIGYTISAVIIGREI